MSRQKLDDQNHPHYKLVIIGAGMAGLGAGRFLKDQNFENFVILEAQDRVGGRVETLEWQEHVLELGAQWLHGTQNPLYEIAKEHGLLAEETSEEGLGLYIRENGQIIDDFLVKLVDFKIGEIFTECERFFETPCTMKSSKSVENIAEKSSELTRTPCIDKTEIPTFVGEFLDQEFGKYLDESPDSEAIKEIKWELFDWHVRFQIVDNSCRNLSELSAKCWGQYVCVDDETHVNLQNGYRPLVDILAENLPIELAKPVLKIDYDDGGNNSQNSNRKNKVRIFIQDDSEVTCDHVIVTVPLGVLKENRIDFKPPLPKEINRSIQDMGYFGIGKIYLIFEDAWWGDTKGFQFIWSRPKNAKISENLEKSAITVKLDDSEELLFGENSWLRHITGFDPVFNQPKVLIGWVGGEGVEIMEKLSEEEVGRQCVKLLRKFVRFRANIPDPIKAVRTRWCSNPYSGGSYCHITPKCDHNFEKNSETNSGAQSALSRPIFIGDDMRLLLAGEACHPSHYSTTHGAFESGQSQAKVLCEHISMKKNLEA